MPRLRVATPAETAAHLVDHVIPRVPVRQWVLSFPIPLRFLFASHPRLVLDGVYRTTEGVPVFHAVRAPTAAELQDLTQPDHKAPHALIDT